MAELLVRVVDKVNPDFYKNIQCTKRGDVILVQPDGWTWGKKELSNPDWRILALPGVDPADLSGLLARELPTDPKTDPKTWPKTLQRRAFKLDLDHQDVTDAGLRDFFDTHDVIATPIPVGVTPVSVDVVSNIEDVAVDGGGNVKTTVTTVTNAVTSLEVASLDADTQAKLAVLPGVSIVDLTLRENVAVAVPHALVTAITVQKPPIVDPNVIGPSPNVIG